MNAFLRRSRPHCELRESAVVRTHAIRVLDTEDDPLGRDVDQLDWAEVSQAILSLKPREQTVITLRFSEQMSHDQIAGRVEPATDHGAGRAQSSTGEASPSIGSPFGSDHNRVQGLSGEERVMKP